MKLVNHCDDHRVYAAGCEPCKARSKAYRTYRAANPAPSREKTMWGPPEHWRRMTEIGRRHEREHGPQPTSYAAQQADIINRTGA